MSTATIAEFDRFDICEAYYLLSCRWGLYGILTRLSEMYFRPGSHLKWNPAALLTENSQAIYDELDRRLNHAIYVEGRDLRGLNTTRSLKGYDLT